MIRASAQVAATCLACLLLPFGSASAATVVSGHFTVDQTPPSAPVVVEPAHDSTLAAPFIRLEVSAQDDTSGIQAYRFEFDQLPVGEGWTETASVALRGISPGAYGWRCQAKDRAGNLSRWSEWSFSFVHGDDDDHDGVPDTWEQAFFGSLDYTDGSGDADQDGATDLQEAEQGTHPFEFSLSLDAGWNLIAFPFSPDDASMETIRLFTSGPLWGWSAEQKTYEELDAPEAFGGIWAYAAEPEKDIALTGRPPATNRIALNPGWNFYGAGLSAIALAEQETIRGAWTWEDGAYQFCPRIEGGLSLEYLKGYWFSSISGGDVEFHSLGPR